MGQLLLIIGFCLLLTFAESETLGNRSLFYIEILETNDETEKILLEDSVKIVNKKLRENNALVQLSLCNVTYRSTDISVLARTLWKSDIIAMIDFSSVPYNACALGTVTKIPLLRIHGSENYRMNDACDRIISMSADYTSYAQATIQILETFQWKKIAFMFEQSRFYEVAYLKNLTRNKNYVYSFVQVDIYSNNDKDEIAFKATKELAKTDADVVLLYVDQGSFLMNETSCYMNKAYVWIIQDMVHKDVMASSNHMVVAFNIYTENSHRRENVNLPNDKTSNLVYEAIDLVAMALVHAKKNGSWLPGDDSATLNSNRQTLHRYITKESKDVTFDKSGSRLVEKLVISNIVNDSLVEIGWWSKATNRVHFNKSISVNRKIHTLTKGLQGQKLSIFVIPNPPYVIKPHNEDGQYNGLCGELIQRIASELKFTYEIHEQPDGRYGKLVNGTWYGMVGSLIDGKADMIVGDLTRTRIREKYVAMTAGYMFYTDKMIMNKLDKIEVNDFLQFMSPMSVEVWCAALVCIIVVTVSMFVLNYLSPYGWKNDHGTNTSLEFSLDNCLWFSFCCMLQQGADHSPKSTSGRVLAGFFWFTIMVWVSTYTANLVAFFTVKNEFFPVTDLRTAIDSKYKIGVSEHSVLHGSFLHTDYELYKKALKRMIDLPKNDSQGLEWVRRGNYIHLAESPFVDYITQREPCDLLAVKGIETPRTFVFALQLHDPNVQDISLAILRLRENGYISHLMDKYVKGTNQCPDDKGKSKISSKASIQLQSLLGVFMVLGAGCVLSFFTLFLERYWHMKQKNKVIVLPQRQATSVATT